LLRLEADACVPDDRGGAFGIVALDMSHQHDNEIDGFAVNKTLSARFFDGPREDVLRAAIEAGLRMGREALGELRAHLENLDERVKPLRADGRRLIAQSFKRVAGGSFEVLNPTECRCRFRVRPSNRKRRMLQRISAAPARFIRAGAAASGSVSRTSFSRIGASRSGMRAPLSKVQAVR
jgi:hypothetical protein